METACRFSIIVPIYNVGEYLKKCVESLEQQNFESYERAAEDLIGGPQLLKFLNALAALATVGTFIIAFLDSYEVRFKVRRRTRGADGSRRLRRKRK